MFRLEEAGDQLGVCCVTFVASNLLHAEGFNALRIDQVDVIRTALIEGFGDSIAIVSRLLHAGSPWLGFGRLLEPGNQGPDAFGVVIETI